MAARSAHGAGDVWAQDLICRIPLAAKMLETGDVHVIAGQLLDTLKLGRH